MPLPSMVTASPATDTLFSTVEPLAVPAVPSELAVAVVVTPPMLIRPPRTETPVSVAVPVAVAVAPVAPDVEVPELKPMPIRGEAAASGFPLVGAELDDPPSRLVSAPVRLVTSGIVGEELEPPPEPA